MEKQIVTIVDSLGLQKQAEIVSIVPSKKENKIYLVYTDVNASEQEMVDLYFAILRESKEELSIDAIESDEEFLYAKSLFEEQVKEL